MDKICDRLNKLNILELIFNSSYDGITYTDENGIIVFNNQAYMDITGIRHVDIVGKSIHSLASQGFPLSNMVLEVFQTRKPLSEVIEYKKSSKEILITLVPVYDGNKIFRGVVGNIRDLTSLNELRNELSLVKANYNQEQIKHQEASKQLEAQRLDNLKLKESIDNLISNLDDMEVLINSKYSIDLLKIAFRISAIDSTVLINGESGVGKDVFCRLIHKLYNQNTPYMKISCGAIPENLMESELFGYEPGAFTGASKQGKKGIFEAAEDGVIFLDEVGELTPALQVKLLTVLQDRKFYRIGGRKEIPVRAKIISATNRNLKEDVENGLFREDLYYRLNVVPVYILPLRERRDDIVHLSNFCLDKLNKKNNTDVRINEEVHQVLSDYHWPGNIRELNNIVERMYIFSTNNEIDLADLPEELKSDSHDYRLPVKGVKDKGLKEIMEDIEAKVISNNLDDNLTLNEIADKLDINISTLQRKISKYKLPRRYKK